MQAAIPCVADALVTILLTPELGAGVLRGGVGAVAVPRSKDLFALLVQVVECPAAWEVCGEGQARSGGVQQTVPWEERRQSSENKGRGLLFSSLRLPGICSNLRRGG